MVPRISRETRERQAYANYLGYCERVKAKPLSFDDWRKLADRPELPNYDQPRYERR